ncbi:hypothetical protein PanWU01x14_159260 [Parasponia andersonii]|uniref:Uncharacterized protein n=1 Tax=Parasponia andersonii TaxID=3476 RepID=A0A2P5CEF3_PARAD|nr:hypothetical protein PanWU01x14_159260 [Parasponia andersonii]
MSGRMSKIKCDLIRKGCMRPPSHKLRATSSERVAYNLHHISCMRPPLHKLYATSFELVMYDLHRRSYVRPPLNRLCATRKKRRLVSASSNG